MSVSRTGVNTGEHGTPVRERLHKLVRVHQWHYWWADRDRFALFCDLVKEQKQGRGRRPALVTVSGSGTVFIFCVSVGLGLPSCFDVFHSYFRMWVHFLLAEAVPGEELCLTFYAALAQRR